MVISAGATGMVPCGIDECAERSMPSIRKERPNECRSIGIAKSNCGSLGCARDDRRVVMRSGVGEMSSVLGLTLQRQ